MNFKESRNRPGYLFAGWYSDENCEKLINPGWVPDRAFTIYDKWIPILYPVQYKLNDGINTRRNPRFVCIEDGVRKLFPAIKKGHCFTGWKWKGEIVEYLPEALHETVELEATFAREIWVTFFVDETTVLSRMKTSRKGKLESLPSASREGYVFTGWYVDRQCLKPFDPGRVITRDLELYAGWQLNTYTIDYDPDGGILRALPRSYYTYEDAPFLLPHPEKEGYRFVGWKDQTGKYRSLVYQHSTGDLKLKAVWNRDSLNLFA